MFIQSDMRRYKWKYVWGRHSMCSRT